MGEGIIQGQQDVRGRNHTRVMTPGCNKQTVILLVNNKHTYLSIVVFTF